MLYLLHFLSSTSAATAAIVARLVLEVAKSVWTCSVPDKQFPIPLSPHQVSFQISAVLEAPILIVPLQRGGPVDDVTNRLMAVVVTFTYPVAQYISP